MTLRNTGIELPQTRRRSLGAAVARTPLVALSVVAVVALVGAACSSSTTPLKAPSTNSPAITTATTAAPAGSSPTSAPSGSSGAATVEVTNTGNGAVLRTSAGLALYTDQADHSDIGSCTGTCAAVWPPLTVPAGTKPTGGSGFTGTLAAVKQPNGSYQVTYEGRPLYTYASDSSGTLNGNGVGGFTVVSPTSSSTATTAAGGGGSGY